MPDTIEEKVDEKSTGESTPSSSQAEDKTEKSTEITISKDGLDIDTPLQLDGTNDAEIASLFLELWNKRVEERRCIREANLNVSREDFEKLLKAKKLDSNLKKCTAFVRKLKQFVESQKIAVAMELNTLNLSKYQSEIASIIVDGKYKHGELQGVLNVCSELHRRYGEFSECLMEKFRKALPTKKTELTGATIGKAASDLRLFAELLLAGIVAQQEGYQVLYGTVKTMTLLDKEASHFVVPFLFLCKGLVDDLLGMFPKSTEAVLQTNGIPPSKILRSHTLTDGQKSDLKGLTLDYFSTVSNTVIERHQKVLKSEKHNRKLLTTRGEIPSDRVEDHAKISSKFEKYHTIASKFASLLDLPMPVLEELPPDPEDELEKALLTTEDGEVLTEVPGIVLYNNEENRQFYQDYPDLKVYLPPVVYRDNLVQMQEKTKKMEEMEKMVDEFDEAAEQAELQDDKDGIDEGTGDMEESDLPPSMRPEKEDEKETTDPKDSVVQPQKQAFSSYLDSLPNCVNKNMIDKAAIEFAECFNNKRHRRELVRRLFLVPRQRVDLLPLYSRLVAILSKVFPDIGIDLSSMLVKDFRYLVHKKDQIKIESKLKITRFIGELVNFCIFPKSEAFNCLKMLLRNFVHHQVEMACALLETCGRVLYRSTDSHRRMKIYLEEMLRKKSVRSLDRRYMYMIDSAYYHICPPPGSSSTRKKKIPLHAYMEYILWEDLNKSTLERAHKVLKMYDWNDPKKQWLVVKILTSPWKFSYVQMESAAALLATLKTVRKTVAQDIIEDLVEQIRLGCDYEFDDFNGFRIATSQFLAYIYTFKALSTTILFNLWYYLISYGVTYRQDVFTKMDPPNCLHRVRMICHMLRICADYLNSSSSKRRLNFFLKYFQRYYVYKRGLPCWKNSEFPYAVEEYYIETFRRIRSRWWLAETMQEAEEDIEEMDKNLREKVKSEDMKNIMSNPMKCLQVSSNISSKAIKKVRNRPIQQSSKGRELDNIVEESATVASEPQKADGAGAQSNNAQTSDPYELDNNKIVPPSQPVEDEDHDFIAEFERMCMEANQLAPKTGKVDLPMPVSASKKTDSPTGDGLVRVTLLTKKNNKPKLKTVEVSAQEDFIVGIRTREEEEKLEKQKLKSRTLAITRLQEEDERRESVQTVTQLFSRTGFNQFAK